MEAIYKIYGWEVVSAKPIQQGLINATYTVNTTQGDYILQSINHSIFKDPAAIDFNINLIGAYLKKNNPTYLFTHLVPALSGKTLIEWEGHFFRAFEKIDGYALSVLDNAHQVEEAAKQFGQFTHILKDIQTDHLKITLPDFHNLSLRYHQFTTALEKGNTTRIAKSKEVISFLIAQKSIVDQYEYFVQHKEVQKRVTHHDTKISNVLFKNNGNSEKAICVIDLDTTMPGYFISDIGDMCRTCLSPVSEEESNLDLIQVDPLKFAALKKGYLSEMSEDLSSIELDHFFFSGQFMIYMQAIRFLTDHLNNDIYYGAKKEGQNYVRALNQMHLLEVYNKLK